MARKSGTSKFTAGGFPLRRQTKKARKTRGKRLEAIKAKSKDG